MRFFPLVLLLLPCLARADCGDCSEVEKQLQRERQREAELHACRSCKVLETDMDGCPAFGYECDIDFPMSVSALTMTSQCQCLETRCAGPIAKLSVAGTLVSKVRCNNISQWMSGSSVAAPAVCAKPCNSAACKASNSLASPDFSPLQVHPATAQTASKCATGDCANGMVAINADGSLLYQLDWRQEVTEVGCTSSGEWAYGPVIRAKNVMCNASPCGPPKCKALIFGPGLISGDVVPLTVTGHGASCATATCALGYHQMTATGVVGAPIAPNELTCGSDGLWQDGSNTYQYVMCTPPPCPGLCNEMPFTASTALYGESNAAITLNTPIRRECTYSCPDDQALFFNTPSGPISIEVAACAGGQYSVGGGQTESQIGCFPCDMEDTEIDALTTVKPQLTQCVLWCPNDMVIQYYEETEPGTKYRVPRLFRQIYGYAPIRPSSGRWYNKEQGRYESNSDIKFMCVPQGG